MKNLLLLNISNYPISLGDTFQSLYLCQLKKYKNLSVALHTDKFRKGSQCINHENIVYYISHLIDIILMFSFVSQILIIENIKEISEKYNIIQNDFYNNFNKIQKILNTKKKKENPDIRDGMKNNCYFFLKDYFLRYDYKPIVVNIRHSNCRTERNSNVFSFIKFFDKIYDYDNKIIFILTGSLEDYKNFKKYFSACRNVFFTKDIIGYSFFDFALSLFSPFLIGTKTGVSTNRRYTENPFLIVDYSYSPHENEGKKNKNQLQKFVFRKYENNIHCEPAISGELLYQNFIEHYYKKEVQEKIKKINKEIKKCKYKKFDFANVNF